MLAVVSEGSFFKGLVSRNEHLKWSWYIFNLSFALYIALMRFVHIFAYIRTNIEPLNLERLI